MIKAAVPSRKQCRRGLPRMLTLLDALLAEVLVPAEDRELEAAE